MTTADVEEALERAAALAGPARLDVNAIVRTGRRRRTRRRAAAAAGCALALAVPAAAVMDALRHRPDALVAGPADRPTADAPTLGAFRDAVAQVFPEMEVLDSRQFDPDPMLDGNESIYSGHERVGGLEATGSERDGLTLGVNWQVLNPHLTDSEAERVVRENTVVDPQRVPAPAPAEDVAFVDGDGLKTRVLRVDSSFVAVAWADDGTVVVARLTGEPASAPAPGDADRLIEFAHALADVPYERDSSSQDWAEQLAARADRMPVVADERRRTNAETGGTRTVACVTVEQAIRDASRDWTRDNGLDGRPVDGTAALRVDYLFPSADGSGRLDRSSVIFDWGTGHRVDAVSQLSVAGGPSVDPSVVERGRTTCPPAPNR